jgi:hypothetical protein
VSHLALIRTNSCRLTLWYLVSLDSRWPGSGDEHGLRLKFESEHLGSMVKWLGQRKRPNRNGCKGTVEHRHVSYFCVSGVSGERELQNPGA